MQFYHRRTGAISFWRVLGGRQGMMRVRRKHMRTSRADKGVLPLLCELRELGVVPARYPKPGSRGGDREYQAKHNVGGRMSTGFCKGPQKNENSKQEPQAHPLARDLPMRRREITRQRRLLDAFRPTSEQTHTDACCRKTKTQTACGGIEGAKPLAINEWHTPNVIRCAPRTVQCHGSFHAAMPPRLTD